MRFSLVFEETAKDEPRLDISALRVRRDAPLKLIPLVTVGESLETGTGIWQRTLDQFGRFRQGGRQDLSYGRWSVGGYALCAEWKKHPQQEAYRDNDPRCSLCGRLGLHRRRNSASLMPLRKLR
ncbi:MAG: hypothetical protein OJF52_001539 [Nitrospira sp.]|nr:MAG: hypothetical protein OJF52_001539 [Nitrospira sp.]